MSSTWSSGADPNSIWNSNSPNLNLLRRYSLSSAATTSTNTVSSIVTSTPLIVANNKIDNNGSLDSGLMSSVASTPTTSTTVQNISESDNNSTTNSNGSITSCNNNNSLTSNSATTPSKSTCSWQPSADGKYLIGYLVISRQDLDINHATQLGLQLCGGKPTHNGQLGAIVEHVVPGSLMNIICKLRVGDEIVEWNGFNLRNKRNDEVINIVESVKNANSLRLVAVRLQQQQQ